VTNRTAATRYARALLDVAVKEQVDVQAIERQLAEFADLLAKHPPLHEALLNPAIPVQRKRAAVEELIRLMKPLPTVAKLLVLLAGRDRLVLVPDLLRTYRERLLDYLKIVRAEVTTAVKLPADRIQAVARSLEKMTGRTVELDTRVDASIIGGVIARIGSTVYDGSVTTQLKKMKERLAASTQ
jgi:F-type H+-transporting ATPase subunit delta